MSKSAKFYFVTAMTVGRIVAAGIVVYLLLEQAAEYAVILFGLAALLDLDGRLARRWEVTTGFGEILDPLADKILILSVVGILLYTGILWTDWFVVPTVIIVGREVLMFVWTIKEFYLQYQERGMKEVRRLFEFNEAGRDSSPKVEIRPKATDIGRKKMIWQCVALFVLIGMQAAVEENDRYIELIGEGLWYLGGGLYWLASYYTLITGVDYTRQIFPRLDPYLSPLLLFCGVPARLD